MKFKTRLATSALFAALLLNGCVTAKVWEEKAFCTPTSKPNLKLSVASARGDVLVQYDELNERTDKVHRRAYFLEANEDRIIRRRKPQFVDIARFNGLQPIPIDPEVLAERRASAAPGADLYAISRIDGFVLHSRSGQRSHSLPVYFERGTRIKQVALTPPALVADTTIVGGCVGLFVLWLYAEGHYHGYAYPLCD